MSTKIQLEFDREDLLILKHCVEVYKNTVSKYEGVRPESLLSEYRNVEKIYNNIRAKLD
jgi:hypothetical protein